jgi:UDP-N-acetylmuramoyl-tripeptide--D-alanyl-D-alanine ligase
MSMSTLAALAQTVGGRLHGADAPFDSVSTDTRSLQPGQLFFALKGGSTDGAAFVGEAARRGAAGAVVNARQSAPVSQVEVPDTRLALGQFARAWRRRFAIPLVGVTGSNGKTTVKEMIAAILRAHCGGDPDAVLMTWGNLNNEVGLPLTLLWLNATHRAAVIEMGAARRGDIAYLAGIAAPTVAVVTNAGRAHLAGFGSIEDVAATKGELFESLAATGTAIINRDDRFFASWWERSAGRGRVTFGLHAAADFRAEDIAHANGAAGPEMTFRMVTPAGNLPVRLAMAGGHNVVNALAAAAAAAAAGATPDAIAAGLAAMRNVPGRLRRIPAECGAMVFDDTYNANPGSVRAAIQFLGGLPGERMLVLGDMAELGPGSAALHREMGELARQAGIEQLLCTGPDSRAAAEAFGPGAEWHETQPALVAAVRRRLRSGAVVLVKGSRCMAMERVVQALAPEAGTAQGHGPP